MCEQRVCLLEQRTNTCCAATPLCERELRPQAIVRIFQCRSSLLRESLLSANEGFRGEGVYSKEAIWMAKRAIVKASRSSIYPTSLDSSRRLYELRDRREIDLRRMLVQVNRRQSALFFVQFRSRFAPGQRGPMRKS